LGGGALVAGLHLVTDPTRSHRYSKLMRADLNRALAPSGLGAQPPGYWRLQVLKARLLAYTVDELAKARLGTDQADDEALISAARTQNEFDMGHFLRRGRILRRMPTVDLTVYRLLQIKENGSPSMALLVQTQLNPQRNWREWRRFRRRLNKRQETQGESAPGLLPGLVGVR
jgi:hypothetical protein